MYILMLMGHRDHFDRLLTSVRSLRESERYALVAFNLPPAVGSIYEHAHIHVLQQFVDM